MQVEAWLYASGEVRKDGRWVVARRGSYASGKEEMQVDGVLAWEKGGLLDVARWTNVMIGPHPWLLGFGSNKNDNKQNDTRRYLD